MTSLMTLAGRWLGVLGAALALGAGSSLGGCAADGPAMGGQIEVVNGPGAPAPDFLLLDWADQAQVLIHDRRVPETGNLPAGRTPLAVIRIAASAGADPERRVTVRGLRGNETISEGTGSLGLVEGKWQSATVVLALLADDDRDGGATSEAGAPDGPVVDANEADTADAGSALPPDAAGPPPDAGVLPVDASLPLDLGPPPPPPPPPVDAGVDRMPDSAPLGPVTLAAVADSYAEQGASSTAMNFGKLATLEVKTQTGQDNNRIAFLRFSLASLQGTPVTATLRLYGRSSGNTNAESVYGVTDESWTESGLTWNNKPAMGAKLATTNVSTASQYREWAVTSFLLSQLAAGRTNLSLAVAMDGDTQSGPDTHNSREAASNQPQLVITR
jgi:hypothetical protein